MPKSFRNNGDKMKKYLFFSLTTILILVLAACSPSASNGGNSSEPTATSVPAISTSIPYDLTVKVTDQNGTPITWATGIVMVSGNNESKEATESGQLVWKNMEAPAESVSVSAQGYKPIQQALSMELGQNEVSIVLEADPAQLNPGKICQPGQKVLYVEDFEDGQAQDLDNIEAPKWSFAQAEDHGTVLEVNSPGGNASTTNWMDFGNAVWMFDLSTSGMIDIDINWHIYETPEGANNGIARYFVVYKPGELFELDYLRPGDSQKLAEAESPIFQADTWHTFAIAYFNGALSVWVDGQQAMSAVQDIPIEKGKLGIKINSGTQAEIQFDNFVVCGLNEAYAAPAVTP
jgi:hypothetical protein